MAMIQGQRLPWAYSGLRLVQWPGQRSLRSPTDTPHMATPRDPDTAARRGISTFRLIERSFDHVVGYLSLLDTNIPIPVNGLHGNPAWIAKHANYDPNGHQIDPFRFGPNVQRVDDPPP
jgi:hypothetical protein